MGAARVDDTPTHLTLQRIDAGSASLHFLPQSILLIPSERLFLQFTQMMPRDLWCPSTEALWT
jgi:hypothetical protein